MPESLPGNGTWIARNGRPREIVRAYQSASRVAASSRSTYTTTSFVGSGRTSTARAFAISRLPTER
jgi:hypothetical protein